MSEELTPPTTLKRQHATAGKGPYNTYVEDYNSAEEALADLPDLATYFDQFDLDAAAQIKLCRAYASYLAASLPKRAKSAEK